MDDLNLQTEIGNRRLVGQHKARELLGRIVNSDRLGHAYLLSGLPDREKRPLR